jgi:hypothetical protein
MTRPAVAATTSSVAMHTDQAIGRARAVMACSAGEYASAHFEGFA